MIILSMIQMVITDLDGTLLNSRQEVSNSDYDCLLELGRQGIVRVVATGRSPYSFSKVIPRDFPIDYLAFSSGAGVMNWSSGEILSSYSLSAEKVHELALLFRNENVPFKVLDPAPENHKYFYYQSGNAHPDFNKRMEYYRGFEKEINFNPPNYGEASQFLIILSEVDEFVRLSALCSGIKVIRATSPLDHKSIWMEVFHQDVSKGNACSFLCKHLGIEQKNTIGIGNDYNDIDMLEFTDQSFVVENAPEDLTKVYKLVASNNNNGFMKAVKASGINI